VLVHVDLVDCYNFCFGSARRHTLPTNSQYDLSQIAHSPLVRIRWRFEGVGSRPTRCVYNLPIIIKKKACHQYVLL
jgi:hypothetical protein